MGVTRAPCYATVTFPALCRGWPHFLVPLAVSAIQAVPRWSSDARQSQPWAWEERVVGLACLDQVSVGDVGLLCALILYMG